MSRAATVIPMPPRFGGESVTTIQHRTATYFGTWPVIEYLLDIFRYPDLLPDTPERRGIMRSLCDTLITGRMPFDDVIEACECSGPITLLDMAVVSAAPPAAKHPMLAPLTRKVFAACGHAVKHEGWADERA